LLLQVFVMVFRRNKARVFSVSPCEEVSQYLSIIIVYFDLEHFMVNSAVMRNFFILFKVFNNKIMLSRQQKEEIVAKLTTEIKESPSCIFADFKGLSANDMVELKTKLRESGSTFQVIKKKLLAIALKNNDIEVDPEELEGQIAVSISSDEVASAKLIHETAKENENIKIVAGVLDNKFITQEEVQALAKLPSMDELRAKLLGQLQAPVSGFVNTLAGVPRSFVQVLSAVRDDKEEA